MMKIFNDKIVDCYLKDINSVPLLSSVEQLRLARLAKKGDTLAKERLVVSNLRFVVKVAKKYVGKDLGLMDLISEGNMGLLRAVESFDPDKGFHFISYAVHWIKQSLVKAIAEKSYAVKLPLSWNNNLCQISRLNTELEGMPAGEQFSFLVSHTGLKSEEIYKLLQIAQPKVSLDCEMRNEKNGEMVSMEKLLSSKCVVGPEYSYVLKSLNEELIAAIDGLEALERDIISNRYALCGEKPKTLESLGKKHRLTKERIRQIEKKALKSLKQRMGAKENMCFIGR